MNLSPSEVLFAAAYAGVVIGAAVAVGGWLADRTVGRDRLERALVRTLGAVLHPLAIGLALGTAGLLSRHAVLVVSAVTGAAAVLHGRRRTNPASRTTVTAPPAATTLVIVAGGAALAAAALLVGFRPEQTQHFESRHYHYEAIAHFVEEGSIWGLPYQNPAFFTATHPANAEVVGAVAALATGGDHLVYGWLLPVTGLLGVLASAALARELGARPWLGALGALAFFAAPLSFGGGAHSLANDLVPVAGCIAAVALVLVARRTGSTGPLWVAGAALGLALGTKYTAFAPTAVVGAAALSLLRPRLRAGLLLPGLAVFAGPWFVRNLVEAGNPLYPQAVRIGGIELFEGGSGPLDPLSGTVAGHVLALRRGALGMWVDLAWLLHGPLLVAAAAGAVIGVTIGIRRRQHVLIAASVFAGTALAAYAVTPYTGAGVPPLEFLMGSNLRYAQIGVLAGVVVLLSVLPERVAVATGAVLLGWSTWKIFDRPLRTDVELSPTLTATAAIVGAAVALGVAVAATRQLSVRWLRPELVAAAVVVAGVGAVGAVGAMAEPTPGPPLERAVAQATATRPATAGDEPKVLAVGVQDLRSLIGPGFERAVVSPAPDVIDNTYDDAATLAADVDASPADILVVGHHHEGVPPEFSPSDAWCAHIEEETVAVYVRRISPAACPAATAAP